LKGGSAKLIPESEKQDIINLVKADDLQGLAVYLLYAAWEETEYRESLFRYALELVKQKAKGGSVK
jgi:hypothetical protein